jgi:hypothetical protein
VRDDLRETPATRHSYVHIAHTRYSHTCVITVTPPHVDSNILYSTLLLALLFGCVVYASATIPPFPLMWIRIPPFTLDPSFHVDVDPDPTIHFNTDLDPTVHFYTDLDPIFHFDPDQDPLPSDANVRPLRIIPAPFLTRLSLHASMGASTAMHGSHFFDADPELEYLHF